MHSSWATAIGSDWTVDLPLLQQLPLPLAYLCADVAGQSTIRRRHDAAFCAFNSCIKLAAAVVVTETRRRRPDAGSEREGGSPAPLLVKPYWHDWLHRIQSESKTLRRRGLPGLCFLAERLCDKRPACRALDAELRDLTKSEKQSEQLYHVAELLGVYRNKHWAHGAVADDLRDRIGRRILAALLEILRTCNVFAGRRLVFVERVSQVQPRTWRIEHLALQGFVPVRLPPVELVADDPRVVPIGDRVYAVDTEAADQSTAAAVGSYDPTHWISLYPHVVYKPEQRAFWFGEMHPVHDGELDDRPSEKKVFVNPQDGSICEEADIFRDEPQAPSPENFRVTAKVASGPFADVYRAWQESVGRPIAVKQLRAAVSDVAEVAMHREIRVLGAVSHPNLISILDYRGRAPQFTMPWIEGPTLQDLLLALQGYDKPTGDDYYLALQTAMGAAAGRWQSMTAGLKAPAENTPAPARLRPADAEPSASYLQHAVGLIAQVAGAVGALHRGDFIHGNLHPRHVLISLVDGRPMLVDLTGPPEGAEAAAELQDRERLRYRAPEQFAQPGVCDKQTDIYRLGVLLWEIVALRPIYSLTDDPNLGELRAAIQYEDPEPLRKFVPTIPIAVDAAVCACLRKNPAERRLSAAEFAQILSQACFSLRSTLATNRFHRLVRICQSYWPSGAPRRS